MIRPSGGAWTDDERAQHQRQHGKAGTPLQHVRCNPPVAKVANLARARQVRGMRCVRWSEMAK